MDSKGLDDIFETMLKAAIYENSEKEAADYLTEPCFDIPMDINKEFKEI